MGVDESSLLILCKEISCVMAKKSTGGIAETVRALAEPVAESLGYFLWDVEYVKEGARMILRLTIDSEEGINIDDCEKMHRAIDPVLDEADPIATAYYLEVSSPGIERELKTPEHIAACRDWDVEAKLFTPVEGSRTVLGVLLGMDEDKNVHILPRGREEALVIPHAAISRLVTVYDFTSGN